MTEGNEATGDAVTPRDIAGFHDLIRKAAEASGYRLNPDRDFVDALIEGLLLNRRRYGYPSCPCRLSTGIREEDLDVICPCEYRDADIGEFGSCYCALYVSPEAAQGKKAITSIPERRPDQETRRKRRADPNGSLGSLPYPVWRCSVCGYLCARKEPPDSCPICMAQKDRFERFL